MRIALGIEYLGHGFHGWQTQKSRRTVEGEVTQAVAKVANHPVKLTCAGRTDARVHAFSQVVHFDTEAERPEHAWMLGVNTHLPPEISIKWVRVVSEEFHARFSAKQRAYRYIIYNASSRPAVLSKRVTWFVPPLDAELMNKAAKVLVGRHDFSSFRAVGCQAASPCRDLSLLNVFRWQDYVVIDVKANAFLHHMVRNIAGVLMAVGQGKEAPEWVERVLQAKDRKVGGVTAEPDGLYFIDVQYPSDFDLPKAVLNPLSGIL